MDRLNKELSTVAIVATVIGALLLIGRLSAGSDVPPFGTVDGMIAGCFVSAVMIFFMIRTR